MIIGKRYQLIKSLGAGGMGEVFLCTPIQHHGHEPPVVLKRVLKSLETDRAVIEKFADEARLMMQLDHPNIVKAVDFFEEADTLYLGLEFIDGENLALIARTLNAMGQQLPLPVIMRAGIQTARALHYVHRYEDETGQNLGIIHRDVTPHNLMLTESGDVKLLDFGIAKATINRHQTAIRSLNGKVLYMSPEQARCQPLDARSDQFSLGVILYELMGRVSVFGEEGFMARLQRVVTCDIPPIDAINDSVPPSLVAVLNRVLQSDPAARFTSCESFANALEACLSDVEPLWDHQRYRQWRVGIKEAMANGIEPKRFSWLKHALTESRPQSSTGESSQRPELDPDATVIDPMAHESSEFTLGTLTRSHETRHNIDPSLTPLIGREDPIKNIINAIDRGRRLITVVGPAGVGKTSLSQTVATRFVQFYSGGVWFCDLANAESAPDIVNTVARSMKVQLKGDDHAHHLSLVLSHHPPALLVLDNFEQVANFALETLGLWLKKAPHLQFLVTSRALLRLDEEFVQRLDPLSLPDGIQLFLERAKSVAQYAMDNEHAQVITKSIVEHLDGLPLAIELAAAQAQFLSLESIELKINGRFRFTLGQRRHTQSRHATLEAAMQWSWDLLKAHQREAMVSLSLFRGNFHLDTAASIVAIPSKTDPEMHRQYVRELIDSLVLQSLVRVISDQKGMPIYRILETVRQYALQTSEADIREAQKRFYQYFSSLADESTFNINFGLGSASRLSFVEQNIPNLQAAMQFAGALGDMEAQGSCGLILMRLGYWLWQNELGLSTIERCPIEQTHGHLKSRLYIATAEIFAQCGMPDQSNLYLSKLEEHLKQCPNVETSLRMKIQRLRQSCSNDSVAIAQWHALESDAQTHACWLELCEIYRNLSEFSPSKIERLEFQKKALETARHYQIEVHEPKLLSDLGHAYSSFGDEEKTVELYHQSFKLAESRGLTARATNALSNLSAQYALMGHLEDAVEWHKKVIERTEKTGNILLRSLNLINLAVLHTRVGRLHHAQREVNEGLSIARSLNWQRFVGHGLGVRAKIEVKLDRLEHGIKDCQDAIKILKSVRQFEACEYEGYLATLHASQGQFRQAHQLLNGARALLQEQDRTIPMTELKISESIVFGLEGNQVQFDLALAHVQEHIRANQLAPRHHIRLDLEEAIRIVSKAGTVILPS